MPFNSIPFLFLFLPAVMFLWWILLNGDRLQNHRILVLLIASYIFYGYFQFPLGFKLLPGVIASTIFNFYVGKFICAAQKEKLRKQLLVFGLCSNLAFLGYFKYLGLFQQTMNSVSLAFSGKEIVSVSNIILPLGISFYTFNSISYLVDVFRKKVPVEESLIRFSLFVSLFPHLLVGPIVRYGDLREQLRNPPRKLSYESLTIGIHFFVFGLAKKIILADALAGRVSEILFQTPNLSLIQSWFGIIAYSLQLYFDFSGYSEMAYGLAIMLGFSFPLNFNSPYKAETIAEFWQRWHISLSTWFRDYLFEPLNWTLTKTVGKKYWFSCTVIAMVITMSLCGLWHGSQWVFLLYGFGHGFFIGLHYLARKYGFSLPHPILARFVTYVSVLFLFVIFTSPDLERTFYIYKSMFGFHGFGIDRIDFMAANMPFKKWISEPFYTADGNIGALFIAVVSSMLLFVQTSPNSNEFRFSNPRLGGLVLGSIFVLSLLLLSSAKPFLYLQF